MMDEIPIINDHGHPVVQGVEMPQDISSIILACCLLGIFHPNWILALCLSSENPYTLSQKSCQFLTSYGVYKVSYQNLSANDKI